MGSPDTSLLDKRIFDALDARLAKMSDIEGGGDGPHNGGMEARVAKLEALAESTDRRLGTIEADLRALRSDFREDVKGVGSDIKVLWGGLIAVAIGLAGLMAKGFGWL